MKFLARVRHTSGTAGRNEITEGRAYFGQILEVQRDGLGPRSPVGGKLLCVAIFNDLGQWSLYHLDDFTPTV